MEQVKQSAAAPYIEIEENSFVFPEKGILEFTARLYTKILTSQPSFIIDIYDEHDHSHPLGHAGWWECPLDGDEEVLVRIENSNGRLSVRFNGADAKLLWENPNFEGTGKSLVVHFVLRAWRSTEILFDDPVLLFPSSEVMKRRQIESRRACSIPENIPPRWFCLPPGLKVHVVFGDMRSAGSFHFCSQIVAVLTETQIPYTVYAHTYTPVQRLHLKPAAYLQHMVTRKDIAFFVYADDVRLLSMIARLTCKKLLYHMHLPDYRRFQAFDAELARRLSDAQGHEEELLCFDGLCFESEQTCHAIMARLQNFLESHLDNKWDAENEVLTSQSIFSGTVQERYQESIYEEQPHLNLKSKKRFVLVEGDHHPFLPKALRFLVTMPELSISLGTFPPCLWARSWHEIVEEPCSVPPLFILSVGSFRPDKHYEHTLKLFAEIGDQHPSIGLVIAGWPAVKGYWDYLRFLHQHTYARFSQRIVFLQGCSDGQLLFLYRRASLFITSSSYDGYSNSVAEALNFNLPVVARRTFTMSKKLGFSGVQYDGHLQPKFIVPDIMRLLEDENRRNLCIAAQKNQVSKDDSAIYAFLNALCHMTDMISCDKLYI